MDISGIPHNILIALYKSMLLIRRFEEKIIDIYPEQEMKSPVHLCIGQEAIAAGVCINLKAHDYMFTNHRSHGHCLAKGMGSRELYSEFYGKITGCCKGKGGSMHPVAPHLGILGTSAIVGGSIPLAVGTALKSSIKKEDNVSVVFFGDGASDEGVFQESLSFASLKKLPVIFVCENNFYATNSPLTSRQPHSDIYRRAAAYDLPGVQIDGNNVANVYRASLQAIEDARSGKGPTLIELKTYRWKGHVGPDFDYKKGYRPKEELTDWMENRCPLKTYENILISQKILESHMCTVMLNSIDEELDSAMQYAKESPYPDRAELYNDVYLK